MKITVKREEHWPMYYEYNGEDTWAELLTDLDVDPRVWEDYKMARDKFLKAEHKLQTHGHNSNK